MKIVTGGQTETPPRTPVLGSMLDSEGRLNIPKRKRDPFLTPERAQSEVGEEEREDEDYEVYEVTAMDIPLPLSPVGGDGNGRGGGNVPGEW